VCGNPARTDLGGGRSVMTVPTALRREFFEPLAAYGIPIEIVALRALAYETLLEVHLYFVNSSIGAARPRSAAPMNSD
jgi:hypothetical protein